MDEEEIDYRTLLEQYIEGDARGVLVVGERRRVMLMNQAARTMFKYAGPVERPLAKIVRDIHVEFAVGEVLHDRRAVWHESYLPEPDRLLRFHLIPVLSMTEEPVLVIATVEDITNLRYLETVRRDFVANVSHELRTPLASINLLVETLQRGATDDPEATEHFLHRIEVETQAMARLVEELLELSRLETGVLSLNLETVEVGRILDDAISRLTPAAEEKRIDINLDVQEAIPRARADPKRLEQVLINLVHNAIKFTPSGGSVSLQATRQGRGIQISVSDNGMGMNSVEAARIFERFYKVDKGRNRAGGAGLGLAIARHLLEMHGSHLHVVSEMGRGSRFSFELPVAS